MNDRVHRRLLLAARAALMVLGLTLGAAAEAGGVGPTFVAGPTLEFSVGFGAGPQSFVLQDRNADGAADIVSIDQITGSAVVLLNQGDGTFGAPQSVLLDAFPTAVAVADLNGDTYADVAVTDDDGGVSLLFGDVNGAIHFSEQIDPGIELTGITAADLDEDGHIDLAVLEVCDEIVLQRNLGSGSFDCFDEEFLETGSMDPVRLASGDVNGDHHVDLLVLNRAGENVSLFLGIGDGTFQAPVQLSIGPGPRDFAIGRVNDDELDDVVVVDAGFFDENVTVLLGDRQMGLRPTEKSLTVLNASSAALADFNGDRCLDLVAASVEEVRPVVGLGDCAGHFAVPLPGPELGFGTAVQTGDLDGDQRPDFLVLDDDGEVFSSALNHTAVACPGDCDASGSVAVNELVVGVNILLGRGVIDACPSFDTNHDGRVTVDELVRGVLSLLHSCSGG